MSVPKADPNFNDDNPNNFTQVTAHLDDNTVNKIKVGGFIEIEKLAQKAKHTKGDNRGVEMISQEGRTFFVPASERENVKVTNFTQWEQAFRSYAAVYTAANPHRGAEIYQYVYTINLASQAYHWDNVMYYDYYFRRMMAENPQRSWAKTYVQLWSLAMRDPIGFRSNNPHSQHSNAKNRHQGAENSYCWRFNRNQCRKSNKDCKFEHRCSFCGILNHSYLNCRKRRNNESSNRDRDGVSNNQSNGRSNKPQQNKN